ncbi:unnamed protein product, partial [Meganyctiphanes norvegica]
DIEPDTTYNNRRGRVHMFNYINISGSDTRNGAKKDSQNVKETFEKLGYSVHCYKDLNANETESELKAIAAHQSLWLQDSLIIIISSHGRRTYFKTSDGSRHNVTWVRDFFSNKNCPAMRNKPKIIIGNFCRGNLDEHDLANSNIKYKLSHMITLFSVTNDTRSKRSATNGSCFITALCQALKNKNNRNKELSIIMNITAKKLEAKKKPHPTSYTEHPLCRFVFKC